jgi:CTP:molybdopterin cytidylyltransferase MocA
MNSVNGLIISAGYSSRMNHFKPLMDYQGMPFLLHIILKIFPICKDITIVTGYRSEEVPEEMERLLSGKPKMNWLKVSAFLPEEWGKIRNKLSYAFNPDFKSGMFSSLQTGLKASTQSDWTLYHFVDQPQIPAIFYAELVQQIDNSFDLIQPRFEGKRAHPILFNQKVKQLILDAAEDQNLKSILQNKSLKKKYWDCSYPEVLIDFDTPADLAQVGASHESI